MSLKRLLPKPKGQHVRHVRYVPLPTHWNRRFHSSFSLQELVQIYESTKHDEGEEFNQGFYERQWRQRCLEDYMVSYPLTESDVKARQEQYNQREADYWTRAKLDKEHVQRFQAHLKSLFHESNRTQAELQYILQA